MKRITIHLDGVKHTTRTTKDGGSKKVIFNTVSHVCETEDAGMSYMADFVKHNEGVRVTKFGFCNVLK